MQRIVDINRLKLLKRQGYGRAGVALLRQRVMQAVEASRWTDYHAQDTMGSPMPWHLAA